MKYAYHWITMQSFIEVFSYIKVTECYRPEHFLLLNKKHNVTFTEVFPVEVNNCPHCLGKIGVLMLY